MNATVASEGGRVAEHAVALDARVRLVSRVDARMDGQRGPLRVGQRVSKTIPCTSPPGESKKNKSSRKEPHLDEALAAAFKAAHEGALARVDAVVTEEVALAGELLVAIGIRTGMWSVLVARERRRGLARCRNDGAAPAISAVPTRARRRGAFQARSRSCDADVAVFHVLLLLRRPLALVFWCDVVLVVVVVRSLLLFLLVRLGVRGNIDPSRALLALPPRALAPHVEDAMEVDLRLTAAMDRLGLGRGGAVVIEVRVDGRIGEGGDAEVGGAGRRGKVIGRIRGLAVVVEDKGELGEGLCLRLGVAWGWLVADDGGLTLARAALVEEVKVEALEGGLRVGREGGKLTEIEAKGRVGLVLDAVLAEATMAFGGGES